MRERERERERERIEVYDHLTPDHTECGHLSQHKHPDGTLPVPSAHAFNIF